MLWHRAGTRISGIVMALALVGGWSGACTRDVHAQGAASRWRVDPATSMVWWQIDPHYNHLWATTCPDDPSWQAGEGRSPGFRYVFDPNLSDAGRPSDKIPVYPRGPVRALCRPAVTGVLLAADTVSWGDARATVGVALDSLVTGLDFRDTYARRMLLETHEFPDLRFTLDSLRSVQQDGARAAGDTLRAVAHGTFELRGVRTPVTVPLKVWPDAGGLRVVGQTGFPPHDLVDRYGMSRMKLGMGVVMKRWSEVHWGFDLIFKLESPGAQ